MILVGRKVRWRTKACVAVSTPYFTGSVFARCVEDTFYDLFLGNIPVVRKADDSGLRWDDVARDMQTAVKVVEDTPANEVTVVEQVGRIVSTAVETRAQMQRSGKQMAKLMASLAAQTEITTEEFANEKKGDRTPRKAYSLRDRNEVAPASPSK